MQLEMTSGASVSRFCGNECNGELIAVFQYSNDAIEFAQRKVGDDREREYFGALYVVTSHYNGKAQMFRATKEEAET